MRNHLEESSSLHSASSVSGISNRYAALLSGLLTWVRESSSGSCYQIGSSPSGCSSLRASLMSFFVSTSVSSLSVEVLGLRVCLTLLMGEDPGQERAEFAEHLEASGLS